MTLTKLEAYVHAGIYRYYRNHRDLIFVPTKVFFRLTVFLDVNFLLELLLEHVQNVCICHKVSDLNSAPLSY